MSKISLFLLAFVALASADSELNLLGHFGDKTFFSKVGRFTNQLTWEKARQICESEDLTLARIETPEENEFIKSHSSIGQIFWIGASKRPNQKEFKWINGDEVVFSNFLTEPSQSTGRMPTYISVMNGIWIQNPNLFSRGFGALCERVEPRPITENWTDDTPTATETDEPTTISETDEPATEEPTTPEAVDPCITKLLDLADQIHNHFQSRSDDDKALKELFRLMEKILSECDSEPTTEPPTTIEPEPTDEPTTIEPTEEPTTIAPTEEPTTIQPTEEPTTVDPTTIAPTEEPTTVEPTTIQPTEAPTTAAPSTTTPDSSSSESKESNETVESPESESKESESKETNESDSKSKESNSKSKESSSKSKESSSKSKESNSKSKESNSKSKESNSKESNSKSKESKSKESKSKESKESKSKESKENSGNGKPPKSNKPPRNIWGIFPNLGK